MSYADESLHRSFPGLRDMSSTVPQLHAVVMQAREQWLMILSKCVHLSCRLEGSQ